MQRDGVRYQVLREGLPGREAEEDSEGCHRWTEGGRKREGYQSDEEGERRLSRGEAGGRVFDLLFLPFIPEKSHGRGPLRRGRGATEGVAHRLTIRDGACLGRWTLNP